ncbi:hypothetical protein K0B96_01825 [Horticoccus luteus]|uniref:HEAT repeat protein n=1 Tax=Horticoccus luteus TaxID=2862869 RepID=A0A8F9TX58_9BACT|nr:hypothetical protein [Horticoccus luteus]QYM79383.1 hypothetical protein K0B96_01825 [Horticoccus luteus]
MMKRSVFLGWTMLVLLSGGMMLHGREARGDDAALEAKARATLWQVFDTEKDWVRVHAAEALIAAGEGAKVRTIFQRDLGTWEKTPARIGAYRVLATLAGTPEERAHYIAAVERVYLDPKNPDRPQAVETLGKLGCVLTGATLEAVREQARQAAPADTIMPWWALENSGDAAARGKLVAALASDGAMKQRAAYALRWLRCDDAGVRRALAAAAAAVKPGTLPYAFVLSAALRTWPDAPEAPIWGKKLRAALVEGDTVARFEAAQTLQYVLRPQDLQDVGPLLDGKEGDDRTAGALVILRVLNEKSTFNGM